MPVGKESEEKGKGKSRIETEEERIMLMHELHQLKDVLNEKINQATMLIDFQMKFSAYGAEILDHCFKIMEADEKFSTKKSIEGK